jgi:tetratricopeptide (TPR) repeat protein
MALNEFATVESFDVFNDEEMRARFQAIRERVADLGLTGRFEAQWVLVDIATSFFTHGGESEVGAVIDRHLASEDPWTRAAVRAFSASLAENEGDIARMRRDVDESVTAFRALGDRWGLAMALSSSAYVLTFDGDLAAAAAAYEEAAALMDELGAGADGGFMRLRLAGLRARQGAYPEARRHVSEVLDSVRGRSHAIAIYAEVVLAYIAWAEGDITVMKQTRDAVRAHLETLPRMLHNGHMQALTMASLALLYVDEDADEARRLAQAAVPVALGTRDQPVIAMAGVAGAWVVAAEGDAERAATMLGAAASLRGADDESDPAIGRLMSRLREQLGAGVATAYRRGRVLARADAHDAITLADPDAGA